MEVVLKAKHTFKTDISNEELFRDRLKVILHLEQNYQSS